MASSDPNRKPKPSPLPPTLESKPVPPSSWAKRTGFRSKFSGEANASDSGKIGPGPRSMCPDSAVDLESGRARALPPANGAHAPTAPVPEKGLEPGAKGNGQVGPPPPAARRAAGRSEEGVEVLPQSVGEDGFVGRQSHMKYELRDTPGFVPIGFYGLQHYISILGSIILIPLVIVPAMGGSYEDTANVVSTVLFMSGMTTLLHTFFGPRFPLIQGPSFVYLAPALAIINFPDFQKLNGNNFQHIMKELQGAIIVASTFQAFLGYSGLMSLLVRVINPVVVAPTIASVGLSFYSYGFPQVDTCLEIGALQYLRKISILGHRVFLIYVVPLGLVISWGAAFLLTKAGAYNFNGCDPNVPPSHVISEHCRKHISRMKQCRVDTSHALSMAPWFRFPYPLQWGTPVFSWKMALVMCFVSIIASVDSVGSYHASSLLVASRPPTRGVLSRGIGLEGLCSVLASLWGTGKVGGFIASVPQVMVAALLCFMWGMLTALGLSNLRYSEAGSSRNIIIVGLSLFFCLSVPAYFQQYGISPNSNVSVPSYLVPYIVASHGPGRTKFGGLNYVLNTLLSLHMVIAFLVAVILDNSVPGSRQEREVYVWSEPEAARREPEVTKNYRLPFRVGRAFRWVKWVGL